jgi:hypothetical protein
MSLEDEVGLVASGKALAMWERAYDGKESESFISQVKSQTIIWRVLGKLLSDLYRERHAAEFDFSDPAFQAKLIYSEGYKKALKDVFRLIPTLTPEK